MHYVWQSFGKFQIFKVGYPCKENNISTLYRLWCQKITTFLRCLCEKTYLIQSIGYCCSINVISLFNLFNNNNVTFLYFSNKKSLLIKPFACKLEILYPGFLSTYSIITEFLNQYRWTPLESGASPSELLNGRQLRGTLNMFFLLGQIHI